MYSIIMYLYLSVFMISSHLGVIHVAKRIRAFPYGGVDYGVQNRGGIDAGAQKWGVWLQIPESVFLTPSLII